MKPWPSSSRACSTPTRSCSRTRPPVLDALLVPALEAAGRRVAGVGREAGAMQQAPEHGELGVEPACDDAFEVDLEVGRAGDPGGVAQAAAAAGRW